MDLFVGPYRFSVYMAIGLTHPKTGVSVSGLIDFEERQILINSSLKSCRWLEVILHEYWHAWCYHFGKPIDEEEQCDRFAVATIQFIQDWHEQGGRESMACLEVRANHDSSMPILKN